MDWAQALASHSLHPVSRALVKAAQARHSFWQAHDVQEVAGQGVQGVLQCEVGRAALPEPSSVFRLGSAQFCGLERTHAPHLQSWLSDAQGWVATFEMSETLRPEALQTVQALQAEGLRVRILSGDGQASVDKVARSLGIDDALGACGPEQKLAALKADQAQGHRVVMVGDGLNDGPVLAGADVSFALGQALPLAQSKADFVLMASDLTPLLQTWLMSRKTLQIVRQNLVWAAAYNLSCVPLALMGYLPAWLAGLGMALSSLGVVLNSLRLSRSHTFAHGAMPLKQTGN